MAAQERSRKAAMSPVQTTPYMLLNKEGQFLQALGAIVTIKATSQQTGGVFNLFEIECPPGFDTPLIIHYTEDVAIYVLVGALAMFWGSEKREAAAGAFFYQPRGTPHGFRVKGHASTRILYMTVPAGFDGFMHENALCVPESEQETAAARYKIEVLGPLPE
jgi:quercetin dioxygenase-like cupin family protein